LQLIKDGLMVGNNELLTLDFNFVSQIERALNLKATKSMELLMDAII
jgi:hypothetical protein